MKKLIQKLAEKEEEVYAKICTVLAVNAEEKTADLQPLDGSAEVQDVYLIPDYTNGGMFLEPEIGSLVCIVFITKESGVLVNFSSLKNYHVKIKEVELHISEEGFLLRKQNETLKKLMSDLITEIRRMKFTTNTGSTIRLVNDSQFVTLENRFKNLLNDN